jgi:hypothetical protein
MNETLHKEYILINGNEVKLRIYFNKDRTNWATSEPKKIGYNVTATPVKRSKSGGCIIEEFTAFSGFNDCLLEIDRQSSKRLQKAITELESRKEKYIKYFVDRYNWINKHDWIEEEKNNISIQKTD